MTALVLFKIVIATGLDTCVSLVAISTEKVLSLSHVDSSIHSLTVLISAM